MRLRLTPAVDTTSVVADAASVGKDAGSILHVATLVVSPVLTPAVVVFAAFFASALDVEFAAAGDWPQILGPNRDAKAVDESLSAEWPEAGPKMLWRHPVGAGFSGVVVKGDAAVVFHRKGDEEIVEALDARSGRVLWTSPHSTGYRASIVQDDGPRATPVVHDGRVFVFGAEGTLRCLELKTGKTVWFRETHEDYAASEGYFGFASTPLVEGNRLIVNVGGARKNAGVVAFHIADGRELWTATSESASYSSPVAATIDGVRHVLAVTRYKLVSLDPEDGAVRFEMDFGKRGPTVNGATPVVMDDRVFLTASYGIGAVTAAVSKSDVRELWSNDESLSSQYTTPVEHEGLMYGVHGRQDAGVASLRCIDPKTGRVKWDEPNFGYATLIGAGGKLLILKTDGELVLAAADPERFRELARAKLFDGTCRALPALAGGRFYARDENHVKCFQLPADSK